LSNNVSVIDGSISRLITTIASVDAHPYGVVYNPSNHNIYAAKYGSNIISLFIPNVM
jgi:YVTN family beta-propeller protein